MGANVRSANPPITRWVSSGVSVSGFPSTPSCPRGGTDFRGRPPFCPCSRDCCRPLLPPAISSSQRLCQPRPQIREIDVSSPKHVNSRSLVSGRRFVGFHRPGHDHRAVGPGGHRTSRIDGQDVEQHLSALHQGRRRPLSLIVLRQRERARNPLSEFHDVDRLPQNFVLHRLLCPAIAAVQGPGPAPTTVLKQAPPPLPN